MKIWQHPQMPNMPSDKVEKYSNKIDNIVTKPKAIDAQAREIGD